jgi:hypothetical protein
MAAIVAALLSAAPASADIVFTLDQSAAFGGVGNYGTVTLHQVSSTTVQITVTLTAGENFAGTGAGGALDFSITKLSPPCSVGSPCANPIITYSSVPSGFQGFQSHPTAEAFHSADFGSFDYEVNCFSTVVSGGACHGASGPSGPLIFDVSIPTGLLIGNLVTPSDFTQNSSGWLFAVDIFKANCGLQACTGLVGTNGNNHTTTPEPASLLLFGGAIGGLAWMRRRRAKPTA